MRSVRFRGRQLPHPHCSAYPPCPLRIEHHRHDDVPAGVESAAPCGRGAGVWRASSGVGEEGRSAYRRPLLRGWGRRGHTRRRRWHDGGWRRWLSGRRGSRRWRRWRCVRRCRRPRAHGDLMPLGVHALLIRNVVALLDGEIGRLPGAGPDCSPTEQAHASSDGRACPGMARGCPKERSQRGGDQRADRCTSGGVFRRRRARRELCLLLRPLPAHAVVGLELLERHAVPGHDRDAGSRHRRAATQDHDDQGESDSSHDIASPFCPHRKTVSLIEWLSHSL